MEYNNNNLPIIIGGFGGSGTRVVAELLKISQFKIGSDLNESNDDLLFTFLLKFPKSYSNPHRTLKLQQDVIRRIELHKKIRMNFKLSYKDYIKVIDIGLQRCWNDTYYNKKWIFQRIRKILFNVNRKNDLMCFKEPHTVYFIEELNKVYPNSKYILIIRNGLDIVYTKTDQQFFKWKDYFGQIDKDICLDAQKFEYWYRFYDTALLQLEKFYKDRYLVVKFEDLFLNRENTSKMIMKFCTIDEKYYSKIFSIPKKPNSFERYKDQDLSWVTTSVKNKLMRFNYKVD